MKTQTSTFGDQTIRGERATDWWTKLLLHPLFVPGVLLVGLAIRLFVAAVIPLEPMSDSAWYIGRAKEMAAGLGYQESGFPTAYWPVGWPAILAGAYLVFGSMPIAVVILNLLGAAAIMLLVLWFGRRIAGSEIVGRLALLAYAFYPNHIAYAGNAATETVYTALAMAAFALMIHGRQRIWILVASGLIFGIATLVKPQTIAFPFGAVIALAIVFRSYSWWSAFRAGLVIYAALLLVVLPWTYRNYMVLGEPVLVSTNGGTALLLGANDLVTGDHFEFQHTEVFTQLGIPWEQRIERQIEMNKAQKEAALKWIRKNTADYVSWMPKKIALLWIKDTDGFWAFDYTYPEARLTVRILQYANQLFYVLVIILALGCGAWATWGVLRRDEQIQQLALLFCMPIFVSLLAAAFTGQIRYHFAAMPFLIAAAWSTLFLAHKTHRVGDEQ